MPTLNHIPDSHRDLLEEPHAVILSTVNHQNKPQSTPVWCLYDRLHIIINTRENSQKDRNIQANPNVSVVVIDPTDSYRYLEIRGTVAERVVDHTLDDLNRITHFYTGKATYFGDLVPVEGAELQTRITYRIKPIKVIARG